MITPLKPLNPITHARYTPALFPASDTRDPLPSSVRAEVSRALEARASHYEDVVDVIDAHIVDLVWPYALRPDEIARDVLRVRKWSSPLTIDQATVVLAAIGEAGYPIAGNGAPDYGHWDARGSWVAPEYQPVRGDERDRVVWAAAKHWAQMASRPITYVSLGDCRGYCARPVQYDNPGSMHPGQRAALTFGPLADRGDECDSHGYMRRHARRLILVAAEMAAEEN